MYSRLKVGHCIMDGIKFEFNDIISLYKKNDSEWRRYVSLGIRHNYILIYGIKKKLTYNKFQINHITISIRYL